MADTLIEQDAIFLPFQVIYDNSVEFYSDANDKEGSVNMKKSLAGFFLLKKNLDEGAAVVTEVCTFFFGWNFLYEYYCRALKFQTKKFCNIFLAYRIG